MNVCGWILKRAGWRVAITAPRRDKCVICVAPHTSNWDFAIGLFAYQSLRRKANFLMKESWFCFPLKYLFESLGGIPVPRKRSGDLTRTLIRDFCQSKYLNLAVTPEGTRAGVTKWHTGFLRIAYGAGVPIQLGIIDYRRKLVIIKDELQPTGDTEADLSRVKQYYKAYGNCARYPEKFNA